MLLASHTSQRTLTKFYPLVIFFPIWSGQPCSSQKMLGENKKCMAFTQPTAEKKKSKVIHSYSWKRITDVHFSLVPPIMQKQEMQYSICKSWSELGIDTSNSSLKLTLYKEPLPLHLLCRTEKQCQSHSVPQPDMFQFWLWCLLAAPWNMQLFSKYCKRPHTDFVNSNGNTTLTPEWCNSLVTKYSVPKSSHTPE